MIVRPDRSPCKRHPILPSLIVTSLAHGLARALSPQPALRDLEASKDEKLVLIHDVQT